MAPLSHVVVYIETLGTAREERHDDHRSLLLGKQQDDTAISGF
jgi:hypothetical protein